MNHFRLDTNGTKLQQHVQYYAEPIFPKLDSDGEARVQDQVMHDTRGNPWEFCHIYRVQHDQHKLLPIGWSMNYMAGALDEQIDASVRQHCLWNLQASWRFVFNASRVLEERYLKQPLGDLGFKRSWAVDPVAPEADVVVSCGGQAAVELADLRTWLNMFLEGSIVYTRATIVFMRRPNGDLIVGLRHDEEAVPNTLPNRFSMICFIRGLDVGSHLWGNNSTAADHNTAGLRLLWWLKNQTSFQRSGSWDHFIALGHICCSFEGIFNLFSLKRNEQNMWPANWATTRPGGRAAQPAERHCLDVSMPSRETVGGGGQKAEKKRLGGGGNCCSVLSGFLVPRLQITPLFSVTVSRSAP
jgi:hypothetical protein